MSTCPCFWGSPVEPTDRHLRDAEVEHLHEVRIALARDEHHVLGLEIAVHDAQRVRAPEGARDLPGDVHRAPELEPALVDDLAQAAALDELEHQEERTVLELSEVRGRRDVRVIDVGGGHRLALEARHDFGHAAHLRVEHLHREALAHVGVLGLVDRTHPAFADQALDEVTPAERHPDEGLRPARPEARSVNLAVSGGQDPFRRGRGVCAVGGGAHDAGQAWAAEGP